MRTTRLPLLLTGATIALAAPGAASASVGCDVNPNIHIAQVTLTAPGDQAMIGRAPGADDLTVNDAACGGATVKNINAIDVEDVSGGATTVYVNLRNGPIGPGLTPENDGTSEIEWTVNQGGDPGDQLKVWGGESGNHIVAGTDGLNLDADGEGAQGYDVDLVAPKLENLMLDGGAGPDVLDASGGDGTGGPLTSSVTELGEDQADTLRGGTGNDQLVPGSGPDVIAGGAGQDDVGYYDAPAGVHVDLAGPATQDTGGSGADTFSGIEDVDGSLFDDVLRGDAGPNHLFGRGGRDDLAGRAGADELVGEPGDDILDGGAGPDRLEGDEGADLIRARDGEPDTIDCGIGSDTFAADPLDALTGCEIASAPAHGGGGGTGGHTGGGGATGGGGPAGAPLHLRLRVGHHLRRHSVPVTVRASRQARVAFAVRTGRHHSVRMARSGRVVGGHRRVHLRLHLSRRTLAAMAGGRTVTLTARAHGTAGGRASAHRRIHLAR